MGDRKGQTDRGKGEDREWEEEGKGSGGAILLPCVLICSCRKNIFKPNPFKPGNGKGKVPKVRKLGCPRRTEGPLVAGDEH